MKNLKLLIALIAFAACSVLNAYKKQSIDITVGGQKRNMVVYTPNTVTSDLPLMIITHGMNQSPEYQSDGDKMYELIDTEKFIVAYLRSDGTTWDVGGDKDLNFVSQSIDEMYSRFQINKNRVYWSGFSMGSMLIYHGLSKPELVKKFAAFAPTSGFLFSVNPAGNLKQKINLIHHQSTSDEVFPLASYPLFDYIAKIVEKNGQGAQQTYIKTPNYNSKEGNYKGNKEVWSNTDDGHVIELFTYPEGGHWPSYYNRKEIWTFCKQFSLMSVEEEYRALYKKAGDLIKEWQFTPAMTQKSIYKSLQDALVTYNPDNMDFTSASTVSKNTTKLNTIMNSFQNTSANIKKVLPNGKLDAQPTEFDPNFHIYLCYGQSNMEGNAAIEAQDRENIDPRFLMMSAVNMSDAVSRGIYNWYVAYPPLCRGYNGLTPADYFGRTMVENLPESIKVGVINVAVGGASIKLFDEETRQSQITGAATFFVNYCKEYNNDPMQRLIDCAKKAQKVGVIKGILLHQGCTDNSQEDWPQRVKRTYLRLLNELGLEESETPLLVGELLQQSVGGVCWGHNNVIARIQNTIPNAHIISSKNCPAASDGLHFTAEGYRMIGKRYAEKMLELLGQKKEVDFDTSKTYFPLTKEAFNPSIYLPGTIKTASSMSTYTATGKNNFGGWRYTKGADLSSARYLVVDLMRSSANAYIKIYDKDDYLSPHFEQRFGSNNKSIVVDLQSMKDADGNTIDASHIYLVGFTADGTTPIYINDVYLSDDGVSPTAVSSPSLDLDHAEKVYYDMTGRRVSSPSNGIYISNGKKIIVK